MARGQFLFYFIASTIKSAGHKRPWDLALLGPSVLTFLVHAESFYMRCLCSCLVCSLPAAAQTSSFPALTSFQSNSHKLYLNSPLSLSLIFFLINKTKSLQCRFLCPYNDRIILTLQLAILTTPDAVWFMTGPHSDKHIVGWATGAYAEFTEWMQPSEHWAQR